MSRLGILWPADKLSEPLTFLTKMRQIESTGPESLVPQAERGTPAGTMATDAIAIAGCGLHLQPAAEEPRLSLEASGHLPLTGAGLPAADESLAPADKQAPDDRELAESAQRGDRQAFDELVRRYDRDVLRIALNILRSSEDARDVYQEAFLKIYRNLPRFRFDCSFHTWMYRIVTNVCLDHLRRRRSRPEDQAPTPASNSNGDPLPGDFFDRQQETRAESDPERRMQGLEIARRISLALERLSPRERMVFVMKHYQGLRLRAIGDALGTTEETVKNSLFRATRKMRVELEGLL